MKQVAALKNAQREELFRETAAKKGITPSAVEKDFWLCWVLMIIFEDPGLSKILKLKGGTSLSKCHNLIDRFSEDIDLILNWTELTDEDPNKPGKSKTQQEKFNESLNLSAVEFIKDSILPIVRNMIEPSCEAGIDDSNHYTINIRYPRAFRDEYLRPELKL